MAIKIFVIFYITNLLGKYTLVLRLKQQQFVWEHTVTKMLMNAVALFVQRVCFFKEKLLILPTPAGSGLSLLEMQSIYSFKNHIHNMLRVNFKIYPQEIEEIQY